MFDDQFKCGHAKSPANTYRQYNGAICLTCKRDRSRAYQRRKAAEHKAKYGNCASTTPVEEQ